MNREGAATNGVENTPIPSRKAEIVYLGADSAPSQGRGHGGHQTYGGVGMVYVRSYYLWRFECWEHVRSHWRRLPRR